MNSSDTQPIAREFAEENIAACIILSIVTCGIYALIWYHHRFRTVNAWLGRSEFNFWPWFFLTLVTCGIYAIYIEYKFANAIVTIQRNNGFEVSENLPMIVLLLSIFGLALVAHAIEQSEINRWYQLGDGSNGSNTPSML